MPDPSQHLRPETLQALRDGLIHQTQSGDGPALPLIDAIRLAAREGRERGLKPEAIIVQLKTLADEVGVPGRVASASDRKPVREWMVEVCLRAFWEQSRKA